MSLKEISEKEDKILVQLVKLNQCLYNPSIKKSEDSQTLIKQSWNAINQYMWETNGVSFKNAKHRWDQLMRNFQRHRESLNSNWYLYTDMEFMLPFMNIKVPVSAQVSEPHNIPGNFILPQIEVAPQVPVSVEVPDNVIEDPPIKTEGYKNYEALQYENEVIEISSDEEMLNDSENLSFSDVSSFFKNQETRLTLAVEKKKTSSTAVTSLTRFAFPSFNIPSSSLSLPNSESLSLSNSLNSHLCSLQNNIASPSPIAMNPQSSALASKNYPPFSFANNVATSSTQSAVSPSSNDFESFSTLENLISSTRIPSLSNNPTSSNSVASSSTISKNLRSSVHASLDDVQLPPSSSGTLSFQKSLSSPTVTKSSRSHVPRPFDVYASSLYQTSAVCENENIENQLPSNSHRRIRDIPLAELSKRKTPAVDDFCAKKSRKRKDEELAIVHSLDKAIDSLFTLRSTFKRYINLKRT